MCYQRGVPIWITWGPHTYFIFIWSNVVGWVVVGVNWLMFQECRREMFWARYCSSCTLRSFFTWSPAERSMIDHLLRDSFGVLSCQFWSTVLHCGGSAADTYLKLDRSVSGSRFPNWGCVALLIVDLLQFCVCCIRSGVSRCTRLMMLNQSTWIVCASAGYTRCPGRTKGILMRHLAAEPRSTAGLLFPLSVSLWNDLADPVFDGVDWRVSRAEAMLFYFRKLLYPYYSLILFFPFSSICILDGIVGLGSSDW